MMKSVVKYAFPLFAAIAALTVSCTDIGPDNRPGEPLTLSREKILVGGEGGTVNLNVTLQSGEWTLSGYQDWCAPDSDQGGSGISRIAVTFTPNTDEEPRETLFEISTTSGENRKSLTVRQLGAGQTIQAPGMNKEYGVNEAIYENVLKKWYFWDTEVAATQADFNQDYDMFNQNYLSVLRDNTADGRVWSTLNERYMHTYVERFPKSETHIPLNFGMEFDLGTLEANKYAVRLLYVTPGSPAERAGLRRGDWIRRIDNRNIGDGRYNRRLIDSLARPDHGEQMVVRVVQRRYDGNIDPNNQRDVVLTPERFKGTPILHSQVIDHMSRENTPVSTGYLVYNSFDPDYREELIDIFRGFNAHRRGNETVGIDNLILDLRYSNSGTVEMAELMGNLIAPESLRGQTFAKYTFNSQQSAHNRTATFAPHENSIGVDMVVIIATNHTAGAAELLINAFNELSDVRMILIGGVTEGLNFGMVRFTDTAETPDYVYDAYPLAFSCENNAGHGDYKYGIQRHVPVDEWSSDNVIWITDFIYADRLKYKDPFVIQALQYAAGNITPPTVPAQFQTSGNIPGNPRELSVRPSMVMEGVNPN